MIQKVVLAMVTTGIVGIAVISDGMLGSSASGAQWYPFYGYQRPSYLDAPCVVSVQPATSQDFPTYSQSTGVPSRCIGHQRCRSAPWYPFYGYHRPSYLDQ